MKHLTLVRHAKSSWEFPELPDRERPLNPRGKRDAPVMGQRLVDRGYRADLIVSSPAERAFVTACTIADVIGYDVERIVVDDAIYGIGVDGLVDLVRAIDDAVGRLMLFGHNPTLTAAVNVLSAVSLDNLPTCGIAQFEFDVDRWAEIGPRMAAATEIDYPKKQH